MEIPASLSVQNVVVQPTKVFPLRMGKYIVFPADIKYEKQRPARSAVVLQEICESTEMWLMVP
jgi:hypothetical protein